MATTKEILRDALRLIREKKRGALREDEKALRKAYGYTRISRKRAKTAVKTINGGVKEAGRNTGVTGEGSETPSGEEKVGT